ncbi:MAG: acyl-CoA dehydrogenase [Rhodospirillaceae bacterium]|nr:acyl-CoA dehydrogenase [Rhodospirillaceae bacterium]
MSNLTTGTYRAPLDDIQYSLQAYGSIGSLRQFPRFETATQDIVDAVLTEGARFAERVFAPLDRVGDLHGCTIAEADVTTPPGFREAYRSFVEQGWQGVPFDPDHGGQGLPWTVAAALQEMLYAANMALSLCPLLTQGAIDLLEAHGSSAQKRRYLGRLVSGQWSGSMNLTEPQAGSDVGALATRAFRDGDGWRIVGQKIFITFGEHDLTENIVHLVLARTPDAPPGTKGISLFIVPKFVVDPEGRPGARNDLRCLSLERKLGIHGSPTCAMSYGDNGGAAAELVGEVNQGMALMFTMMNNARLAVAIQGLACGERAWQTARAYAGERRQGRIARTPAGKSAVIANHPDVQRMLMTMRALMEGMRALVYATAAATDRARQMEPGQQRDRWQARADLLTPIAKAWCTDRGCEIADLGIQVHGGMGYIEESGAAQIYRDARITPIYEGTNGIQAIDLLGRKLLRDQGAAVFALCNEFREAVRGSGNKSVVIPLQASTLAALDRLDRCSRHLIDAASKNPNNALSVATPYLRLLGNSIAAALLVQGVSMASQRAGMENDAARRNAIVAFFCASILPETAMLEAQILANDALGATAAIGLELTEP